MLESPQDAPPSSGSERSSFTSLGRLFSDSHLVTAFRLDPDRAVLPHECACCLTTAAESRREVRSTDGATLIVPYCSSCLWHVSAAATRSLAATLASVLFAVTFAAALPLLWTAPAAPLYGAIVVAGALFPLAVLRIFGARRRAGHAAHSRAVWFLRDGQVACASSAWAERLQQTAGQRGAPRRAREPNANPWALSGVGVALMAVPLFYPLHFPEVRVVNLTGSVLTISSDGREICRVTPTTQESPSAGVIARFPAGHRLVRAMNAEGELIDERRVFIQNRAEHLYAPGSDAYCFWLETTAYGRHADKPGVAPRAIEPLRHDKQFWTLSPLVDTWFSPNPATASDQWSTGGELNALRQARCLEAPRAVREAMVR